MAKNESSKGNPATKRMSNPRNKAERAKCYENGLRRKDERKLKVQGEERTNKYLREQGNYTSWEIAKGRRAVMREHLQTV